MGSNYENAPATKMLATHCAICRRPLVDAKSVEVGMGPDCRKRFGYDVEVSDEARVAANKIICAIALDRTDLATALPQLEALGFEKLVAIIAKRRSKVRIEPSPEGFAVKTPYDELFVERIRRVVGARWQREGKVWTVPADSKRALWDAIKESFAGEYIKSERGVSRI